MKPVASISLDLDNQWSYMKTHGDAGWEALPSYLDLVVPRILSFLDERKLRITFFIVGQDAALVKNHAAIKSIADAGHEIANHSFNHEPWLHLYSKPEIEDEFRRTEEAIHSVTGIRTVGFRGPGFSLSDTVIEVLGERGYEYDCSALPTYAGPAARAFYFLRAPKMSPEEKEKLNKLFGKFSDGFRSLKPHYIRADGRQIVEIPVTTFPLVKVPIHASYFLYLASFSKAAARLYWRSAMVAARLTGVEPSLLLHPLDFLSGNDVAELKFFPGMSLPAEEKVEILADAVSTMTARFEVLTMREHADAFRRRAETAADQQLAAGTNFAKPGQRT